MRTKANKKQEWIVCGSLAAGPVRFRNVFSRRALPNCIALAIARALRRLLLLLLFFTPLYPVGLFIRTINI